jgi:hypothetical protein
MFRKISSQAIFESLESRQFMSVTSAVVNQGVLTVNCDSASDNVKIVMDTVPSFPISTSLAKTRLQLVPQSFAVWDRTTLVGRYSNRSIRSIVVNGNGGNDILDARSAGRAVILNGGDGGDFLYGGAGRDSLNGNLGIDWLLGGAGNDSVDGGGDDAGDYLFGEAGDDSIRAYRDYVDGGAGWDTLTYYWECDHTTTWRNIENVIYSPC